MMLLLPIEVNDPLVCGAYFVGSCNGLVCWLKKESNDVLLWNLSTRKCKKLPHSPAEFPRSFSMIESFLYGFGYDHRSDDYKVVEIAECYRDQLFCTLVMVYSLKKNVWRRVQDIPRHIRFTGDCGKFTSGALHCLALSNPVNGSMVIVAFDLAVENYRELPIPEVGIINKTGCPVTFNSSSVVVVGECLCLLDNYPGSHTDMWLINGYGVDNSWSKLCSVKISDIPQLSRFVRPVAFSRSCKKVLLEGDSKKLMWYDLESKKVEDVNMLGIPSKFDSHAYTESLVQITDDPLSDGMELLKQSHDKKEKKQKFLYVNNLTRV